MYSSEKFFLNLRFFMVTRPQDGIIKFIENNISNEVIDKWFLLEGSESFIRDDFRKIIEELDELADLNPREIDVRHNSKIYQLLKHQKDYVDRHIHIRRIVDAVRNDSYEEYAAIVLKRLVDAYCECNIRVISVKSIGVGLEDIYYKNKDAGKWSYRCILNVLTDIGVIDWNREDDEITIHGSDELIEAARQLSVL